MIVGREVKYLDNTGVVKATIETVAENFVDGFLSPLCFALVGGVPLAMAYKMINTLDSMVGYKNEKYILFGRVAAKIDDIANYIPARISLVVISFAAGLLDIRKGKRALLTGFKDGRLHKSPNAGYPEAAFAGALKIKLGGPNYYHGKLVEKPYIGSRFKNPESGKAYIRNHAQELDDRVIKEHISLYVNNFSSRLGEEGEAAIRIFFNKAELAGFIKPNKKPLFACQD